MPLFGIFGAGFLCINGRRHSPLQAYGFARLPVVRRNPRPKSQWTYMQSVYAVVEWLWNQLPAVDKVEWLYGWKPPHFSARDYFGRHNMVYVARWNRWIRRPPAHHAEATPRTLAPLSEPVPSEFGECLGGEFVAQPYGLWTRTQYIRSGFGTGGSRQASWNAAYAVVMAKPWIKTTGDAVTNAGYSYYYGSYWGSTIYQAYTECTLVPGTMWAWSPWELGVWGGWPGYGPKGYGFEVRAMSYATKGGSQAPDWLVGWLPPRAGMRILGMVPGWPKYAAPPAASQWVGVQAGLTIPTIYGR